MNKNSCLTNVSRFIFELKIKDTVLVSLPPQLKVMDMSCVYVFPCTRTHVHTQVHTYTCPCVHICIHMHICPYTQEHFS